MTPTHLCRIISAIMLSSLEGSAAFFPQFCQIWLLSESSFKDDKVPMNSSTRGQKALPELIEERVPSSATSAIRCLRHCLLRYPFVRQWKSSPEPVCQQQSGTVTSSQSQAVVEQGHCQKVCSKVVTRGSLKEPGEGTIDLLMLMQSDKWGARWLGNREKGSASSWAGMQCILHSPQKVRKSRNAFLMWSNRLRLRSGKGSTTLQATPASYPLAQRELESTSQHSVLLTHQHPQNASDSTCVQPEQGMQIIGAKATVPSNLTHFV